MEKSYKLKKCNCPTTWWTIRKDINKPIGASEFSYNELPEDIKSELPSEKQLQEELKKIDIE